MLTPSAFNPHQSALFTDLYELTMMQAYYVEGVTREAVFELFFREMPKSRNYIMAAGLDDVLAYLEELRFADDELRWLDDQGIFSAAFLERLADLKFTGDVYAVPEGTIVFQNEPVVQVVAPLPEAQLVETYVLNQVHFQSVAASKAARVVRSARGRKVVDFGSRRSHGTDAALKMARASFLAGVGGTSNVAASRLYAIPVVGTMAHSYIEAHDDERSAFKAFADEFPETTLLVDTYDSLEGVRRVIELARTSGDEFQVRAIRLDSGDLGELARRCRELLDDAGLTRVSIFASSGLNEYKITDLLTSGAPIDGFGVGTEMAVSSDAPDIDFAYKLVAYDGEPRMKLSSSKVTMPGRKQVFRVSEGGRMLGDVIGRFDEDQPGEPLLRQVMRRGKRCKAGHVALKHARAHAETQLAALPPALHALERVENGYSVAASAALKEETERLQQALESGQSRLPAD